MSKRRTSDGYLGGAIVSKSKHKSEFGITEKDLPAIKDWKVGEKYTMTVNVRMLSSSKGNDYDVLSSDGKEKEIHNGRFEILSIDAMPSKNAKAERGN